MELADRPEYGTLLDQEEVLAYAEPLRSLVQTTGWPIFLELMKRQRIMAREMFETVEDPKEFAQLKGLIAGLKRAEEVVVEAIQTAEALEKGDELRSTVRRHVFNEAMSGGGDASF